jgi:hypothetical protein
MEPIFIEDSMVPVILSYIAPIEIYAITLFPFVFARGKINAETRNHETIHFQQYLETLVIGFLIIYAYDYIKGYLKHRNGEEAYLQLRAEQEAYEYDKDYGYTLGRRKRWKWLTKYKV